MFQFILGFVTGAFVAQNYNMPNINRIKDDIFKFLEDNEIEKKKKS